MHRASPQPAPTTAHVEYVPCPLCGEMRTRRLFQDRGFAMGRCLGCGLVRQNPRFPAQRMVRLHYDGRVQKGGFRWRGRRQEAPALEDWQPRPLRAYELSVADVERNRRRAGARGTWVDVGASTGSLLLAARAAGWTALGVEPGSHQVDVCRRVHGMDVRHGTLREAGLPDAAAEVVSYRHVLEHIHDPVAELREARRVLEPDGMLLVEVPNYGGVRYRGGRLRMAVRLGRPYWESLNVPEHLFYFTPETLIRLLELGGFRPTWMRTYGKARARIGPLRRLYESRRDRWLLGNNLRVLASRPKSPASRTVSPETSS